MQGYWEAKLNKILFEQVVAVLEAFIAGIQKQRKRIEELQDTLRNLSGNFTNQEKAFTQAGHDQIVLLERQSSSMTTTDLEGLARTWSTYAEELGLANFSDIADMIQDESRKVQATIQKVARMVLSRSPKNQLNIANHPDVRDPNKLQAMLRDAFFKALPLMGANPRGDAKP